MDSTRVERRALGQFHGDRPDLGQLPGLLEKKEALHKTVKALSSKPLEQQMAMEELQRVLGDIQRVVARRCS